MKKEKKYGSFNPTSVNSFCSVAGGRNSPQVGDFDPATGGGFSSGHPGSDFLKMHMSFLYQFLDPC
jgi:hypothetical protein